MVSVTAFFLTKNISLREVELVSGLGKPDDLAPVAQTLEEVLRVSMITLLKSQQK